MDEQNKHIITVVRLYFEDDTVAFEVDEACPAASTLIHYTFKDHYGGPSADEQLTEWQQTRGIDSLCYVQFDLPAVADLAAEGNSIADYRVEHGMYPTPDDPAHNVCYY